jgi:pimeloyl-ACP methyl ester carboxylesterase
VITRDHPEVVSAMVLDGVSPVEIDRLNEQARKSEFALFELFAACEADSACNEQFPNLQQITYDLIAELNANPVIHPVTNPLTGEEIEMIVDGKRLIGGIFFALQAGDTAVTLPQAIYAARDGDFTAFDNAFVLPLLLIENISTGMFLSVVCHDEVYTTTAEELQADNAQVEVLDAWALQIAFGSGETLVQVCNDWGALAADPLEGEPVVSDVPTLLLSGQFDPATPSYWADIAAENLSNSFSYVFPGKGHAESISDACMGSVVVAFINDTSTAPDASCIDEMQVVFSGTSADVASETLDIELEETTVVQYSLVTLVPVGWNEVAPGTYLRGESAADSTAMVALGVPLSQEELLVNLLPSFGLTELPEPSGERAEGELSWTWYEIVVTGIPAYLAIAEQDGSTYLVVVQGAEEDMPVLFEQVFLPVLDNTRPE